MPGVYRFDIPNNAIATAKGQSVLIQLQGAANMVPVLIEIELIGWDNQATAISSNMIQIDGLATNGNNALKLKSLDLRSNDATVAALEVRGGTGGTGLNGGKAANFLGGGAVPVGRQEGMVFIRLVVVPFRIVVDGVYNLDSPYSGQGGLRVSGNMTNAAALFQGDSYTDGMRVTGGYGWAGGINANISGSVGSLLTVRPKEKHGL